MEHSMRQQIESNQQYSLGNQSTEIMPIVNMDTVNQIGTSTEQTLTIDNLPAQIDDQSEWAAIAAENNTLISFHSLPINLEQLDPETQLAIRQNLVSDPNNPDQQSIIAYDGDSDGVINRLDMINPKTINGIDSEMGDTSSALISTNNGNVLNENEAVLLLHRTEDVLPESSLSDLQTPKFQLQPNIIKSSSDCAVVFCRVSATISTDVIERIPECESVIWSEIHTELDVQMEMTENHQCTIYGSIDTIIKLNNKLQEMLNGTSGRTYHVKDVKESCDQSIQCDILVPHISSRGRQVHQPSRYTGFYKDPMSDPDEDSDAVSKRRYRRKYTPAPQELAAGKVPEFIVRPFKFSCGICSFKTTRQSHYQKHQRIHESRNIQLHKCKKCTFVAIRLSHLHRHELQHSTSIHKCDLCSYETNQAFYLKRHKKYKHPPSKKYLTCNICNFQTYQRINFNRHRKLHLVPVAKKTFECGSCSYKTDVSTRYQRHLTHVHGDARPYLCDDCGKSFKRTDALKAHKRTHVDRENRVLPHVCEVCSKGFGSRAHLKEHEISHKKERPFLCHLCGASFKSQSVQKKHTTTIHMNPRSFTCEICSKSFNTRFTLMRHKRTHDNQTSNVVRQQLSTTPTEAETLEQVQQTLVQDIIGVNIEEPFDQSEDGLRQTYVIPSNETTTALFYLTENLPI